MPKLIVMSTPPGFEFIDSVAIGGPHGLTIPQQSMGSANVTLGNFGGFDGIMGFVRQIQFLAPSSLIRAQYRPTDLTVGSLVTAQTESIPTVTDNAFALGLIQAREVGLFFAPATIDIPGSVDFGGVDVTKFLGFINYV